MAVKGVILNANIRHETLQVRIESVRESQKRTRLALFVCVIVSLSVIIVYWNTHLSWYKRSSFNQKFDANEVTRKLEEESLSAWIRSHTISVPLFGINVGADDIPELGSLSLLIITAWLYSCVKRDNQTIGLLLIDSKDQPIELRDLIIYGITSHFIFTLRGELEPVRDLERPPKNSGVNILPFLINKIPIFLPAISVGFVLIMEVVSTFLITSVFAGTTIFNYWIRHDDYHGRMYEYLVYMSICLVFTVIILVIPSC